MMEGIMKEDVTGEEEEIKGRKSRKSIIVRGLKEAGKKAGEER